MSLRFITRIVFVVAMAFTLSAPLLGTAAATNCDPGTNPGLC
jgi:hypothetical protein